MTARFGLLALLLAILQPAAGPPAGLLIKNGTVIDGSGSPARRLGIRVAGDAIAELRDGLTPRSGRREEGGYHGVRSGRCSGSRRTRQRGPATLGHRVRRRQRRGRARQWCDDEGASGPRPHARWGDRERRVLTWRGGSRAAPL